MFRIADIWDRDAIVPPLLGAPSLCVWFIIMDVNLSQFKAVELHRIDEQKIDGGQCSQSLTPIQGKQCQQSASMAIYT